MVDKKTLELADRLELLADKRQQINTVLDSVNKDFKSRLQAKIQEASSLPEIPSVMEAMPVLPRGEAEYLLKKERVKKSSARFYPAIAAAVLMFVLFLYNLSAPFLFVLAIVFGIIAFICRPNMNEKYDVMSLEIYYPNERAAFEKSMKDFRTGLAHYEKQEKTSISAAKKHGETYREHYNQYLQLCAEWEEKKKSLLEQRDAVEAQMEECGVSFYYAHEVAELLRSGEATDCEMAQEIILEKEANEEMDMTELAFDLEEEPYGIYED